MNDAQADYKTFADYNERPSSRSRLVIVLAAVVLILAVLGGLFLLGLFSKKQKKVAPPTKITITVTPLPTSSVSAVLTPIMTTTLSPTGLSSKDMSTNLDRSKLNVTVLNGSGEKGAAGAMSSYLEGLGYKIVRVGNADAFTYRNVSVQTKNSKSVYIVLLKRDLQANPSFASVSASVSDDIPSDAEVIVGK